MPMFQTHSNKRIKLKWKKRIFFLMNIMNIILEMS